MVQDLLFILSMLVLAQFWNLLAGYGGLVSVGPQAFVGNGPYAMFGAAILWGWDPVLALALSGLAASTGCCARDAGWRWQRCGTMSKRPRRWASMRDG